jgi:hypothetical protein
MLAELIGVALLPFALYPRRYDDEGPPEGEGLKLLENWRGASFADLIHKTGFSEPGKGAPHGDEDTRFAAHT